MQNPKISENENQEVNAFKNKILLFYKQKQITIFMIYTLHYVRLTFNTDYFYFQAEKLLKQNIKLKCIEENLRAFPRSCKTIDRNKYMIYLLLGRLLRSKSAFEMW